MPAVTAISTICFFERVYRFKVSIDFSSATLQHHIETQPDIIKLMVAASSNETVNMNKEI